ncbi:MAG: 16S rRNA (cytosine(1402)-N(4))-methyltransferase RsmH [Chitinophagaceae bacterium]|nr:16S rRNA (cytosine(1402)-N(4))-methyltransferase RsmH [Chitinophagaceae bacterium]MCW5929117.1 16S rRNA (cytosine(1402)-N(4))-methyltransferase RsmH [Chitinophagaceae bacterium]
MMEQQYHIPVLLEEAITALNIQPDGVYVDCTLGGGGHSRAILSQLGEKGKLFVFDQDEDAGKNVPDDKRVTFVPHNFRHIQRFLKLYDAAPVDGILADLGVSSHQFDEPQRGFSTRFEEAPLDMRMDQQQEITAAGLLHTSSESELHKLFEQYGEVTNAKTLARVIIEQRKLMPLKSVNDFKQAVAAAVKGNPNKYFAQVFQALRIVVNDEMQSLKDLLQQTPPLLKKGGRVAVITFHSIEDRLVKNFFKYGGFEQPVGDSVYGIQAESPFNILTKKPIVPSEKEVKQNSRSRSAKLRVAEKK